MHPQLLIVEAFKINGAVTFYGGIKGQDPDYIIRCVARQWTIWNIVTAKRTLTVNIYQSGHVAQNTY